MPKLTTLATCQLNNWAMDFDGNLQRIIESIHLSQKAGARLRTGPELEVTGYGCQDHFLEADTYLHSWESLSVILKDDSCSDILIDVGMPVMHRNVRYNCRVICYNGKILLIRPKLWLAQEGNYREMRYFTPWMREGHVEEYFLPRFIQDIVGRANVPFGDAVISTRDTCLGCETCEELFTPAAPHAAMSLNGVEIFTNSSGSHHELRKLDTRYNLIIEATRKAGGVYLYANQQGCDGDRLYYDGSAMIVMNGKVLAQGSQFSLSDVEVITATVNLEEVRSFRSAPSRHLQATQARSYERIKLNESLSDESLRPNRVRTIPIKPSFHLPEEEIALGPACWLWDYLRRSHQAGFFLALSGGIDSCATAVITYSMCRLVVEACKDGNEQVLKDARALCSDPDWEASTPQELCGRILHTCFMGTENSSTETRGRARDLAKKMGAYHTDINMDSVVSSFTAVLKAATGYIPKFRAHGGSIASDLALQNLQARGRMVISYMFAQLLPTVRQRPGGGSLLVLASGNCDEALRGYATKYDAGSADLAPIGSISKEDLKRFIGWAATNFDLPILQTFLSATPTAELAPLSTNQSDEVDMGMTYKELSAFGTLRKVYKMGPWSMYERLVQDWGDRLDPAEVAVKVRRFFHYYSINRHKMTVLTPAYHAEAYSPEDNRFDLRPFLYPPFTHAYRKIEGAVEAWRQYVSSSSDDQSS